MGIFLKLQYFGKIQKVCRAAFCVPCQQAVGVSATSGAHDPQIEVSTFASSRCLLEPSRDNTTIPCVTTYQVKNESRIPEGMELRYRLYTQ